MFRHISTIFRERDFKILMMLKLRYNFYVCMRLTFFFAGDQIKKTERGRTCSKYVGEERCIEGFGEETWGKEATWKTRA